MSDIITKNENAYRRAIKTVGIGKKGSRSMDKTLIDALNNEINEGAVPAESLGALLGALMIKGVSEEESKLTESLRPHLFDSPEAVIGLLGGDALSEALKGIYIKLINAQTLTKEESLELGRALFSSDLPSGLKGLAASILRVRYETTDEYMGLLASIKETFEPGFRKAPVSKEPVILMAEPFDGVDHTYMITPLVASFFQSIGYQAVSLCGRSSGPKQGINLFDIVNALDYPFLTSNEQLNRSAPETGWYLDQAALSKALDEWVDIRHHTIKRPFLATLERFTDPIGADIMIASAFHPPYGEKMMDLCEAAGFPAAIIVRNGMEGGLGFPLLRSAKILCSVKKKGKYARHEFDFNSKKELEHKLNVEDKLKGPELKKNSDLIRTYKRTQHTDNPHFDLRVKATCLGLQKAIEWIETNKG